MAISKITRNFQVTLPKDVREFKNFRVGDKVLFVVEDQRIELIKMDKKIISDAAGLWSDIRETGVEYERRVRKAWKRRTLS